MRLFMIFFERILKIVAILYFMLAVVLLWLFVKPGNGVSDEIPVDCNLEGVQLIWRHIDDSENFWIYYFDRSEALFNKTKYTYEENGVHKVFLRYGFRGGESDENWGNLRILLVEYEDEYVVYYTIQPDGGFVLENNPYSKKIRFEKVVNWGDTYISIRASNHKWCRL